MVAFYSQEDQDIYEKNKFMPQSKYLLNAPTFDTPTETISETQNFGIPYTNAFTGSGGGGGRGFGAFGDLDKSSMKKFYDGEGNIVEGYKNIGSGLYQDEQGLNIQNLGIKARPLFANVLNAIGFNMDDGEDPKYPGYFTKNKFGTLLKNPASFKHFYDRQDVAKQEALQKEIDADNKAAANRGRVALLNERMRDEGVTGDNYNQAANIAGGGGGNTAGARQATYDKDPTTGTAQSYSQHYAKGGRTGYFFGGRVNYKVGGRVSFKNGGLASIL